MILGTKSIALYIRSDQHALAVGAKLTLELFVVRILLNDIFKLSNVI